MTSSAYRPIITAPLFAELDDKLIELLSGLDDRDWSQPTIVPRWTVKQVAGHLLDTALRRLSLDRDRTAPPDNGPPPVPPADLVGFVNDLNARGVAIYGRLSPRVLISLMRVAARELSEHFLSIDPMAPAAWSVSWAGEDQSLNWFDTAREFTERWHHQQQIRLALDRPGIQTPHLYGPVLDCFMRALPYACRDVPAQSGAVVAVRIDGPSGGVWRIRKSADGWRLIDPEDATPPFATTTIPEEVAWRIFTKGLSPAVAREHVRISGDEHAGSAVLRMIAIVG
jgi:uncharacterized protein (TIGR03083 family)